MHSLKQGRDGSLKTGTTNGFRVVQQEYSNTPTATKNIKGNTFERRNKVVSINST